MKTFEIRRLIHEDTIKVEGDSLCDAFDRLAEELELPDSHMAVTDKVIYYEASDLEETYVAEETIEEFRKANSGNVTES